VIRYRRFFSSLPSAPITQILDIATSHGLLHKIHGRETILRTSLYMDDAALFVAPFKEDIANLSLVFQDLEK
jgi:hypothetical protein